MDLDPLIRAVQTILVVDVDGKDGPQTWLAIFKKITGKEWQATTSAGLPVEIPDDMVDARSEKNIATLIPEARVYARALVNAAKAAGITIKIIDGSRTYAEQDALYAKGRTALGSRVTNARGGSSNHNFGIAFDIGVFSGTAYVPESPLYKAVGAIGKRLGLLWGGDWKSIVDEPHFEFNPKGYTLAQLRDRKAKGLSLV